MKTNPVWFALQVWLLLFAAFPVTSRADGSFRVERGRMPEIVLTEGMRPFVSRAASDLAGDLERIFGERPAVTTGSVATADAILVTKGGTGWENYTIESRSGNVLAITGSDDRGAMFGIYRFASECLGVDPFYHWSGRKPAKTAGRTWDSIAIHQGDPSFRFRAWFINDEDFLNGFRPEENGKREIAYSRYHVCFGPSLADEIYETAVRAGFNTVICASYVDILNPDEKRLIDIASGRGLYITMHHQEPVGAGARQLDLHFPEIKETSYASHPDLWRKAWRRYVEEWAKVPDVIWQLGLRGRGDRPFWLNTGQWSSPDVSEDEDRRRAGLISRAMSEQLAMIEAALGHRPAHFATQLWMEGAEYYRRGFLTIPQGTIVIFSDNCPGLKFQSDIGGVKALDLSKPYGLYYHLALVHGNHRCELVPPLRTHQILSDAWQKGARELVLFNVSNIRPFLYTIESAGEMTRNLAGFDAERFRDSWAATRFGQQAAAVARAIDLFFAAYETVYSRDDTSSYGSPRERAPLAILNDGLLCSATQALIRRLRSDDTPAVSPVVSQYLKDPNRLTVTSGDLHVRVNQDMHPFLEDSMRNALLARAQAAAFRRCLEQVERAYAGMDWAQRLQLFERFGYPSEFMSLSSDCYSELAFAVEAKSMEDWKSAKRHALTALNLSTERDRLERRYNAGRWKHWYDRDIIYPYSAHSAALRQAIATLPADTLRLPDGSHVTSAEEWNKVRPQILHFFEEEVYGAFPPKPAKLEFKLVEEGEAFDGSAIRRQYVVQCGDTDGSISFDVLVYLPKTANGETPIPAFIYPNFCGNHTLTDDPAVREYDGYPFEGKRRTRGQFRDRVSIETLIQRGFAFATYCFGAVYPDFPPEKDGSPDSAWKLFAKGRLPKEKLAHPAWAWGAVRVRDLLETLPAVNQQKVAIIGHSRMAKTAILAGAHDPRFALVCANCGGMKSIKALPNLRYPYWFSEKLKRYADSDKSGSTPEDWMDLAAARPDPPFDQASLAACIAPRALAVSAASESSNPRPQIGKALVLGASPVFKLFGQSIGWRVKKGHHAITHDDWNWFMDYAQKELNW